MIRMATSIDAAKIVKQEGFNPFKIFCKISATIVFEIDRELAPFMRSILMDAGFDSAYSE